MAKHLSALEREQIFKYLNERKNLNEIARLLSRDRKSIVMEIKRNRYFIHKGSFGMAKVYCQKATDRTCVKKDVCPHCPTKNKYCWTCQKCVRYCDDYIKAGCEQITASPYCCNACPKDSICTLARYRYSPLTAQKSYEKRLVETRKGISLNEKQLDDIGRIINEGSKKGQSINHIVAANRDRLPCSSRTIYSLVRKNLVGVSLFDLPRTVQRRQRNAKKSGHKVDQACRQGRTYQDFLDFKGKHPELDHVQMDTVEGVQEDVKCFLSLSFPHLQLSLFFLLERQTAYHVKSFFYWLYKEIGEENFKKLFPLALTDRGSEFTDPESIEHLGTKIFYCDAMASHQKGHVENQNGLFRRIVPKKHHIDGLEFEDSFLINSHLASYIKKSLNQKTPYELLSLLYGEELCRALRLKHIPANEVLLKPQLLQGKLKRKHYET